MKIPNFRRIFYTDYPQDQQPLIQKLSVTINNGFENPYNALQNNISLADNIACTVKQVTLTVDSTGTPTTATSFSVTTTGTLTGLTVMAATNQTTATVYPTGNPFISYTQNSQLITITNVAGLPANNSFLLTIVAWI